VVKEERLGLDLFANLAAVLSFFALEGLAFYGSRLRWESALLSALALPLAYAAYQVAVVKTRSWGDAVETLFDLHRADLKSQLKLRKTTDADDEKQLWEKASRFFRPPSGVLAGEIFDPTLPPGAANITSGGDITVIKIDDTVFEPDEVAVTPVPASETGGPIKATAVFRSLSYGFAVSRSAKAVQATESQFSVSDPRVSAIDEIPQPSSDIEGAAAHVLSNRLSPLVVWNISKLARGGSIILAYSLPLWLIEISPAANAKFIRIDTARFRLIASDSTSQGHSLIATYLGSNFRLPRLTRGGEMIKGVVNGGTITYDVDLSVDGRAVTLILPSPEAAA
jgi:hypothetical protein